MPSGPADAGFILEQVSRCLRLAASCEDEEVVSGLLRLAKMFAQRAIELGVDPGLIPDEAREGFLPTLH